MVPKEKENKIKDLPVTPLGDAAVPSVILDSLADAVLMVGTQSEIKYLNKVAERLIGYTLAEAKNQHCSQIMQCEACYEGCRLERLILTGEKAGDFETVLRDRSGKLLNIQGYTTLVRNAAGAVIGGLEVFRNLSHMKTFSDPLRTKQNRMPSHVVGKNRKIQEIYELLPEIAKTKSTVLIEGESGAGKELLAHAIHQLSPRRDQAFIRVNCGALAEGILESELFGHVRGAFTGAVATKMGRFELADGGTLFLDEIGDISLSTQVKLLRVLQEEEFERVGDTKRIKVDVRVIAATHKDLIKAIQEGEFRPDLYYRLRVMPIQLPPLRERREDIPQLINFFLAKFNREFGRKVNEISSEALEILLNYPYPGNIRELENIIEHAMVLCTASTIQVEHLPMDIRTFRFDQQSELSPSQKEKSGWGSKKLSVLDNPLKISEREVILQILEQTNWNYRETARRLNKSRVTLWRKMKDLGITAPRQQKKGMQ